jgi:hypothetical protein
MTHLIHTSTYLCSALHRKDKIVVGKEKRKERYGIVGYKWFSFQGRMVRMINAERM